MGQPDYMKFFRDRHAASKGETAKERTKAMYLALWEYEQARRVTLIWRDDWEKRSDGDPMKCRPCAPFMFGSIMTELLDEGRDAQEAFDIAIEPERHVFRVMQERERAKPGELLATMPQADREFAMGLLGAGKVVRLIAASGSLGSVVGMMHD